MWTSPRPHKPEAKAKDDLGRSQRPHKLVKFLRLRFRLVEDFFRLRFRLVEDFFRLRFRLVEDFFRLRFRLVEKPMTSQA
jgi:hypothetical protein